MDQPVRADIAIPRPQDAPAPFRVAIVLGHPRGTDSLCGALAESYRAAATAAGCAVAYFDLSQLAFDGDVRVRNPAAQTLEPDLRRVQAAIREADHVVLVYPTWWGTWPARLKGLLDRILTPGFAFRETTGGTGFEGLLGGRTAELLTTMDTPRPVYDVLYRAPGHSALARATLGFCGIRTSRITAFGPVKDSAPEDRRRWIRAASELGAALPGRVWSPQRRAKRTLADWARALRLQFYPMTFLAYAAGSVWAGEATGRGVDALAFWLGYLALFLIEAATVFCNDVFDFESDRRNRHYGPFSGGARVLVDGRLTRRALLRGAAAALVVAVAAIAVLASRAPAQAPAILAVMAALVVLGLGYTVPPLKLSHRGWGEATVGATHSFGVVLAGTAVQGAGLGEAWPWVVATPLCLAILPAIVLSGIPDWEADRAAGKRTLAVRWGLRRAVGLAAAMTVVAVAAGALFALLGAADGALALLPWIAAAHGAWLIARLARLRRELTEARRIDGTMTIALGFIVWFAAVPLVDLWVG